MSRLNNRGVVAPCEADITSAVSMLMLNAMNGGNASLNDMVALDESDQSLNLWHCGVAPGCWADGCGVNWDAHFNIGSYRGEQWNGDGVVADMQFKPGAVTLAAFDIRFEHLFVLTGEIMKDKRGYAGSSGWVNNLKIGGKGVTIPDLINTISAGRVNHHYPAAFGNLDSELREFAFWTDTAVLEKVEYQVHMSPFLY
jgi:L-fucose isomerase-like protein